MENSTANCVSIQEHIISESQAKTLATDYSLQVIKYFEEFLHEREINDE